VHRQCIVDATKDCRFIALSYVWGGAKTLGAVKSNIEELRRSNGLTIAAKDLPLAQTILDAIELVRQIDESYLWVDNLCIVQDDEEDLRNQIDAMDQVYGAAVMTIIAAGGDDANAGLAGVRPSSRTITQLVEKVSATTSLAVPIQAKFYVDESTWNSRAWTYQERLLSKRFLIFSPNGVVWHCRSVLWYEDYILEAEHVEDNEMMGFDQRLRFLNPQPGWTVNWEVAPQTKNQVRLFRSPTMDNFVWVISEYTRRKLTYNADILNAFAGIQRVLSLGFSEGSFQGLPIAHLDFATLWAPGEALKRREQSCEFECSKFMFPSWSWAGWIGRVFYVALFPASNRPSEEERIRPLLHWYRFNINSALQRIPQRWELGDWGASTLKCTAWSPLQPPVDLYSSPPMVPFKLPPDNHKALLCFRTSVAELRVKRRHNSEEEPDLELILDVISDNGEWAGVLHMHSRDAAARSSCDLLVISEAQNVGVRDIDRKMHDGDWDYFNFYAVLAVTWNSSLATRIGIGRVRKSLWAEAKHDWRDVLLG